MWTPMRNNVTFMLFKQSQQKHNSTDIKYELSIKRLGIQTFYLHIVELKKLQFLSV